MLFLLVVPNQQELQSSAILQVPSAGPLRIGDGARKLSDKDIADIEVVAMAAGGKPWLLEGPVGQLGGSIVAYLPAVSQTSELRRGATMTLIRQDSQGSWTTANLRLNRPGQYAQVKLAGRDFNSVSGVEDLNRPFAVTGAFVDAELISLITFIRSSPGNVEGRWPIEFVGRQADDSVNVSLHQINGSLIMMARLRKRDSGWTVESARSGRA